jgi:dihydrofolate synthase/folylpolyglutamate synthase
MTYADAIQFLYGLQVFGARPGLETTRQLAALAGNPQDKLRFIHVAGTNGKGSTCAMLESIYRAAGLRVGLFTSPHLVSFRERIQVNRQLISEADVVRLVAEVAAGILPAIETGFQPGGKIVENPVRRETFETTASSSASPGGRMPPSTAGRMPAATTLFEVVTVLALRYFAEQKCDLVIWETGLGGRLDATNIVTPLASVITSIGLDHQQWLGNTLAEIAAEKAGIIKPGVPVVTAERGAAAGAVIERVAREQAAPLIRVEQPPDTRAPLPASLLGAHQQANAMLAVATVHALSGGIPVSEETIRQGLETVHWPGRLQLLIRAAGQKVLVDGAHNLDGVQGLAAALRSHYPHPSPTFILGVLGDKDWGAMCEILAPLAARILLVPVGSERTAQPEALAAVCRKLNPKAEVWCGDSLPEALDRAARDAFVVIAGSLYLVGEALALLDPNFRDAADERRLNEWGGLPKSGQRPASDSTR